MKKKILISGLFIVLLLILLSRFGLSIGNLKIGHQNDFIQPNKSLQYRDSPFARNLKGITVVTIWASWCAPCIEEIPMLKKLAIQNLEVQFLSLSIDKSETDLENAIAKHQVTNDVTMENRNYRQAILNFLENRETDSTAKTEIIPKTFILKDGKVIKTIIGMLEEDELQPFLDQK